MNDPKTLGDVLREQQARLEREEQTRREVIFDYARIHDRFSEMEQLFVAEGRMYEAEGAHQYALMAVRAYKAECDDPEVPE